MTQTYQKMHDRKESPYRRDKGERIMWRVDDSKSQPDMCLQSIRMMEELINSHIQTELPGFENPEAKAKMIRRAELLIGNMIKERTALLLAAKYDKRESE